MISQVDIDDIETGPTALEIKQALEIERLRYYEKRVHAMQGRLFFIQADNGVLRRWIPPELRSQ